MRALAEMTWVELKLFTREPITVVFVLVLPLVTLYVLNGVFGTETSPEVWEGRSPVDFYTSAYVALVVATVGVLSLPVQLAGYREKGVLRRFRASALPPSVLVTAHGIVAVVMGTLGAALLVVVSRLGYGAALPQDWPAVLLAFALVTMAFAALGALLGSVMPTARAAQGVGVLLFFVFMMLGGAGPPREVLPDATRAIGDVVPLTYAARLLRGPWLGDGLDWTAAAVMIGLLAVSAALTWWRLRAASAA
jgi:ABC-2 type transport system permease protein